MLARLMPRPRAIPATGDPTPTRTVAGYVWRMSGWHQVAISTLALVVAALAMAPLELQRRLVNDGIGEGDLDLVLGLGGLWIGVVLVAGAAKYGLRLYQEWLSESAIRYCRRHLLTVHRERLEEGRQAEDGRAVAILGREIDQLGGFVGEGLSQVVVNAGMLAAIAGYMLVVDPRIAAVGLALIIPQAIGAPLAQRRLNRFVARRVRLLRRLSDDVAAMTPEHREPPERLWPELDDIYTNRLRIAALKHLIKGTVNVVNNLAPAAVFVAGGWLVVEGATSVGVVVAFASGVQRMAEPIRELANFVRVIARAGVQHEMIAKWM